MRYILSLLLLFTVSSYADVTVDCNSADYSYSPAVKDACEEMQKAMVDAKKQGNERFSELLAEKRNALKAQAQARKEAAATEAKSSTSNNTPDSTAASPNNANPGTGLVNQPATQMPAAPIIKNQQPIQQSITAPQPTNVTPTSPAAKTPATPGIPPSYTAPATIPVPSASDSPEKPATQPAPGTQSPSVKYY